MNHQRLNREHPFSILWHYFVDTRLQIRLQYIANNQALIT